MTVEMVITCVGKTAGWELQLFAEQTWNSDRCKLEIRSEKL